MPAALARPMDAPAPRAGRSAAAQRRSTNLTLAAGLVAEAQSLGVNLSQAAEMGIAAAVSRRRQEAWLAENRDALDGSNAYVEAHGLPLARHRNF
ncbi:MAG: type II toxin-antitoxin system CcdA family antitoxin [Roseateles sp.]|uniref:type II toxin-antitoxin system CcdA family antitoxin n=1 Tax=Roseateles sp. TaxID=1971397 RepID=UPI0039EC8AF0